VYLGNNDCKGVGESRMEVAVTCRMSVPMWAFAFHSFPTLRIYFPDST